MYGVLRLSRSKSSMLISTSASCAMASRCSTALVDPPIASTTIMAFSSDSFVMMSRGLMSRSRSL